ncbi:hypothetical protein KJ865_04050, partial [Myxococcota bacterium]|nr:hypothetical protein [Myxococcota bacterium]
MDKVHGIKKSPLQMVKEKFESKEKLAEKIVELLAKSKEEKQQLKETLLVASNKQLLRLFDIGNSMKSRFGSK